jgi:hypothetical protein
MDKPSRLLKHLDEIDKHIATAAMTLFIISLLYLTLLADASLELQMPGLNIKLQKALALAVGCPIIFLLIQYIMIAVFAMVRIEKSLSHEQDPMDPTLRTPTVFAMLFLLSQRAETRLHRLAFVLHSIILYGIFYALPIVTCAFIIRWLIINDGRVSLIVLSVTCTGACIVEFFVTARVSLQRLKVTQVKV